MKKALILAITLTALFLLGTLPAGAGWSQDPTENNPVCIATGSQLAPDLVGDGAGGTFMVWSDSRSGTSDIYAQRMDATGAVLWAVDGIAVCTAASSQTAPRLVSDGAGGAIIERHLCPAG